MFTAWFYSRQASSHRTPPLNYIPPILSVVRLSPFVHFHSKKAWLIGGTKLSFFFAYIANSNPLKHNNNTNSISDRGKAVSHNRMFISTEYCTEFNERVSYKMAFCAIFSGATVIAMGPTNVHISQISFKGI